MSSIEKSPSPTSVVVDNDTTTKDGDYVVVNPQDKRQVDIVIVGCGISGICAAVYLQKYCPTKSFVILEGRNEIGGTWDLQRYPGVRSDTDMFTFGYSFKPWKNPQNSFATGDAIMNYLKETLTEYNLWDKIHFHHKVNKTAWSHGNVGWKLNVTNTTTQSEQEWNCQFLFMCSGYYSYEKPYQPQFPGQENFNGPIIHPQLWPKKKKTKKNNSTEENATNGHAKEEENEEYYEYDYEFYKNKRVIVIGSGATAITLVPAMADDVKHITMLQRSPSYVVALPNRAKLCMFLYKIFHFLGLFLVGNAQKFILLPFLMVRWMRIGLGTFYYHKCRTEPTKMKTMFLNQVQDHLEKNLPMSVLLQEHDKEKGENDEKTTKKKKDIMVKEYMEKHFTPKYHPWDQRLCVVPEGNFFTAMQSGNVSIETDEIDHFTPGGIVLKQSQKEVEADIIITATGLNMQAHSGMNISILHDDKKKCDNNVDPDETIIKVSDKFTYRGIMLQDVPNMFAFLGYINASWTLRCEITAQYACRLINYMDQIGMKQCTPIKTENDDAKAETAKSFDEMNSGYIRRNRHLLPNVGDDPWKVTQNFWKEKNSFAKDPIHDNGILVYSQPHKNNIMCTQNK